MQRREGGGRRKEEGGGGKDIKSCFSFREEEKCFKHEEELF